MSRNKPSDLEALREIFRDERVWIALGIIKKLDLATDNSVLWAEVSILPEERTIVTRMTWDDTGANAGIYSFPQVNDLVLVGFAEGDEENAFILRRLSTKEDKIPVQAVEGDIAVVAKSGKKIWITSAEKVYLSKSDTAPTENFVLGQVFKQLMSDFLQEVATHTHTSGPPGSPTSPPLTAAQFTALKASPVQDEAILSDTIFGEK